jgi:hypothetical protein
VRYLFGFLCVCALVGTSPLSASAQAGEEGATPEPNLQEPAPEEPALQLKLDDAGVEVAPTPARTFGGYTLEELELRKRRAGLALIAPAVVTTAGIVLFVYGTSGDCYDDQADDWDYRDGCRRPRDAGMVLTISGGVGMIVGSVLYGVRAKEFRRAAKDYTPLEEADLRVRGAKIGLGVSVPTILLAPMAVLAASPVCFGEPCPEGSPGLAATFAVMAAGGLAGTIASGILLRRGKQDRDRLRQAHYGTPRRVQWDPAQSRLVF